MISVAGLGLVERKCYLSIGYTGFVIDCNYPDSHVGYNDWTIFMPNMNLLSGNGDYYFFC